MVAPGRALGSFKLRGGSCGLRFDNLLKRGMKPVLGLLNFMLVQLKLLSITCSGNNTRDSVPISGGQSVTYAQEQTSCAFVLM